METGVPLDDGPELIAFTPDPKAAQAEAAGQEGAAQPPARPAYPGAAHPPGGPAAPQGPPARAPAGGPQARPTARRGRLPPAQEAFQPFRERKGKAPEPPPPDAPPAQLATEYGPGLSALKTKCAVSGVLTGVLVVLSLLDSGLLPFLTGLVPTEIALWAGLALFAVCGGLCFDVLQQGLLQLTNRAPTGDTLALFAAVFTLADGVTLVAAPFREVTLPFFAPCALVLTFHLLGQYCDRSAKFQACRTAASVAQPYVVTQDANVLGGQPAFRKWLGLPRGFGSQIRTTSQGRGPVPPADPGAAGGLLRPVPGDHRGPPPALAGALVPVGPVLRRGLPWGPPCPWPSPAPAGGQAGQAGGGPGRLARPAGRQGVQGRPAAGPGRPPPPAPSPSPAPGCLGACPWSGRCPTPPR